MFVVKQAQKKQIIQIRIILLVVLFICVGTSVEIAKYSDPEYVAFVLIFAKQHILRVIKLFVFLIQLLVSTKEVLGV